MIYSFSTFVIGLIVFCSVIIGYIPLPGIGSYVFTASISAVISFFGAYGFIVESTKRK